MIDSSKRMETVEKNLTKRRRNERASHSTISVEGKEGVKGGNGGGGEERGKNIHVRKEGKN